MTRQEAYARYRQLVDDELPRRAREGRWVVTADHCFGRILLDHAVGGRWYDVLDRRRSPASAQLDDDQLSAAVAFLTVAEVAALMRVSKMTVYRLVHGGELAAVRVGRSFRLPERAVHDYLRAAYTAIA